MGLLRISDWCSSGRSFAFGFPLKAYNLVYNEYYRDETLINEVALTSEVIQKRAWEKDYFTSALPWQQRGTAPSLPLSGTGSAVWDAAKVIVGAGSMP